MRYRVRPVPTDVAAARADCARVIRDAAPDIDEDAYAACDEQRIDEVTR